ncbi:MAG: hypothetical protein HC850_08735 [Rhodomicrobium sp.]|nr:hypothetical protein [Rhodomicrobium sp.]
MRLYDFASGNLVALLPGHKDVILGLAFSPDSKRLVSGSADYTAIVWDVERGVLEHNLRGHQGHIFALAFTPDNTRVVTGSYDKELRIWRLSDGRQIAKMPGHGDRVRSLAMGPDGTIYSGDSSGEIRVWDGQTGAAIKVLAKNQRTVSAMSVTPDGRYMLTGEGEGTGTRLCHIYDLATGQEIGQYKGHDNIVIGSAISPDGKWAATGGGSNKEIHIWDVATGQRRLRDDGLPLTLGGLGQSVWTVGWSPDGKRIAWGHKDGGLNSGPLHYALTLPGDDNALPSPEPIDEATAATFRRAEVTHDGRLIRHRKGGSYNDDAVLEFLNDGRIVGTVERGQSSGYDHRAYSFSNDGRTVLSGGSNGVLASYNSEGGDLVEYVGHEGDVWAVVPSPDDRFVLSGSADQTIRLWNMKTHELLFTLFHSRDGEWVMWTPQGYYVGSPRGAELVGWQINKGIDKAADYVTAAQLRKALRRSDIVSMHAPATPDAFYLTGIDTDRVAPAADAIALVGLFALARIFISLAAMDVGTAFGTIVLHVTPESHVGGPLALVRTGDLIELDVAKRKLHLHVTEDELAVRRKKWRAPKPALDRGYTRLYVEHVNQASEGADLDFLVGKSGHVVVRESH